LISLLVKIASATDNSQQGSVTPLNQGNNFLHSQTANNFDDLNDKELYVLVSLATHTLQDRGTATASIVPPQPKQPDIFDNTNFKQIACAGIKRYIQWFTIRINSYFKPCPFQMAKLGMVLCYDIRTRWQGPRFNTPFFSS
jgi:hypothetical protein